MSDVVRAKVRGFIEERFPAVAARKLTDSDSLLESGIIDSLGILDLAMFVERDLGVQMADDDLTPENFDSLNALLTFLASKGVA